MSVAVVAAAAAAATAAISTKPGGATTSPLSNQVIAQDTALDDDDDDDEASQFPIVSPPGSPPTEPIVAAPALRPAPRRLVYLHRRHLPLWARLLLRTLDTLQTLFLNVVGLTLVTLAAPLSLLIAVTPCHALWDGAMLEVLQRSWDILDVVEEGENVRIGDWIHLKWHARQLATKSRTRSSSRRNDEDAAPLQLEALPALHKNDSGIDLQWMGAENQLRYR